MDGNKAPTSQMVCLHSVRARYSNRLARLKQPKLSRTDHPRVEQMKKFQRQITEGVETRKQKPRECIRESGPGIGMANR